MIHFLIGAGVGSALTLAAIKIAVKRSLDKDVKEMEDVIAEAMAAVNGGPVICSNSEDGLPAGIIIKKEAWEKRKSELLALGLNYIDMYVDLGDKYSTKRFYKKDMARLVDCMILAEAKGLDYYLMHDNHLVEKI